MGWHILLGCESFWRACIAGERGFPLRALMDLSLTCRGFREHIPVLLVVRLAYEGKQHDSLLRKVDAQQLLGLTAYMLRAHASPIPFLTAFELAYARLGGPRRVERTDKAEARWALIRRSRRDTWAAELQARRERLSQAKRRVRVDALLDAEGVPALEGSRFSRLVWLAYRKHEIQASQHYLASCARGYVDFDLEQAAASYHQDERCRFFNLDRLDQLIGCGFPTEREPKLLAYLEKDGMLDWRVGADGTRGAYFENCLVGMSPFYLPAMRMHYALLNVPWLTARYRDELKRLSPGNVTDTGKPARSIIKKRLAQRRIKFHHCSIAKTLPRLLAQPLF